MEYTKPHLPYDQQLAVMVGRGMRYADKAVAMHALKTIGYYRLSAYTYVLRAEGPRNEDGTRGPRLDTFVANASLEDAIKLHDFDRDLRAVLLDVLQQIEIGLRVKIGYYLGKTDPFGHVTRESLDESACSKPVSLGDTTVEAFHKWEKTYENLVRDARGEVFVQHFNTKYEGRVPVWAATELMTFGALLWLFELLPAKDSKRIAQDLGIRDARLLHRYLKALNVLRNHCAHNGRIWNRSTTYPPAKPPVQLTPSTLHHLRKPGADPDKLYYLAALSAHFVTVLNPRSNWPRKFKTLVRKFPSVHGMTPENVMGFPENWEEEPLWNYEPVRKAPQV